MADVVAVTPAKKAKVAKAKKPKAAPSHPKVSEMVTEAISTLRERGGSSLVAIKKYIASNYKVDVERVSTFIKKYLKTAVVNGDLVQTKGTGATGSFRLGGGGAVAGKKPASKPRKASAAKTASKPKAKATPKKVAKPKKAAAPKKPKSSPAKKAKKPAAKKAAAKKPKAVKAKKPKTSPKKAAKRGKK